MGGTKGGGQGSGQGGYGGYGRPRRAFNVASEQERLTKHKERVEKRKKGKLAARMAGGTPLGTALSPEEKMESLELSVQLKDIAVQQLEIDLRRVKAAHLLGQADDKQVAAAQATYDKKVVTAINEQENARKDQRNYAIKLQNLEQTNKIMDSIGVKIGLQTSGFGATVKNVRKLHRKLVETHGTILAMPILAKRFASSIMTMLHPLNIVETLMRNIWVETWEMFVRSSKAIATMNGRIGDTGTVAKAAGKAVRFSMGVEIEEAAQAAAGLAGSLTSLTSMSRQTQTGLIGIAAELERVSIGAGQSGDGITFLTRAMGKSAKTSAHQWKMMAVQAQAFGKLPDQFSSDFISATKVLTAHGPKMMKVFFDLESVAKASGIAFDKLLSITAKFDTFDSAATAVGNLNALLGGDYLNTLEMMNMTEGERVKALKSSLEMAGKNFDQMERFERKAIAESLAMDEAELAQMMNMSNREARKAKREAKQKAKDQKAYNKMIKQTVDIMKSLRMLYTAIFMKTGLAKAFGKVFTKLFAFFNPKSDTGRAVRRMTDILGDFMVTVVEGGLEWFDKWIVQGDFFIGILGVISDTIENLRKHMKSGDWDAFAIEMSKGMLVFKEKLLTFLTGPAMAPVRKAVEALILGPIEQGFDAIFIRLGKKLRKGAKGKGLLGGDSLPMNAVAALFEGFGTDMRKEDALAMNEKILGAGTWAALAKTKTQFKASGGTFEDFLEQTLVKPSKDQQKKLQDLWNAKSPSKYMLALGKDIVAGFTQGLKPTALEAMMDRLVESTDAWAESLKEVALAAGNVGAAVGGPAAAGGAAGNGATISIEIGGDVLATYILDTVREEAKHIAKNT